MKQNALFIRSRWRLATWYAGIISVILLICGLGVCETMIHVHNITVDQELKSVAGTIHDGLLPIFKQPGKLEPDITSLLPNLCLVGNNCHNFDHLESYRLGAIQQGKYYLRLFDLSGQLVAVAGIKPQLPNLFQDSQWQTVIEANGVRYRQISLLLHTQNAENWGYLQVGRSLQDFDNYIANFRLIFWLGIPIIALLVMVASWCLAGLAILPIYQSYWQIQRFTADAAHELRTPLAAIQATVQANLSLPVLPELQARDTLKTILRQNKRLSYLVADLLTLCRIDGELNHPSYITQKEQIDLEALIGEIVEELTALAMALDIELTYLAKVSHSLQVMGDRQQLYRLIVNLVTNAIQYNLPGGQVIVSIKQENLCAIVSIQDTGIGISKKEQQQIFERFYRVDKARSQSNNGFGLGLAIAKAIALAHRGSIQVESEVDRGSIFTLKLPLRGSKNSFLDSN